MRFAYPSKTNMWLNVIEWMYLLILSHYWGEFLVSIIYVMLGDYDKIDGLYDVFTMNHYLNFGLFNVNYIVVLTMTCQWKLSFIMWTKSRHFF